MNATTLAIRTIATGLDAAALLGLAAVLELARVRLGARLAGLPAFPWRQTWHDLVRLTRKRRLRPEFASPLHGIWPLVALAATLTLTLLVPGFAGNQVTMRFATIPLIVALLALGRAARVLAALDAGAGGPGLAAADAAFDGIRADAVWLLAFAALGLTGVTGPLGVAGHMPAVAVIVLATVGVLLTHQEEAQVPGDYAGPDRAVFIVEAVIRRALFLVVLIDFAAPTGMADAAAPLSWPAGFAALALKFSAGAFILGLARQLLPDGAPAIGLGFVLAAVAVALLRPVAPPVLALGSGILLMVWGLAWLWRSRPTIEAAVLLQGGVALVGFGFGIARAGWIVLGGLLLARVAAALAGRGWLALCCLVAVAGLPPFGLFTGDFLVVSASVRVSVALAVILVAVLLLGAVRLAGISVPVEVPPPIGTVRTAGVVLLLLALVVLAAAPLPGFLP